MYQNLEILNKIKHKDYSIKELKDFFYAKNLINAPITVAVFFETCKIIQYFLLKIKMKIGLHL